MSSSRTRGKAPVVARGRRRNSRNDRKSLQTPALSAVTSASTTPASSAFPSAYPTEDEAESAKVQKIQSFRFLDLPSELRTKIYSCAFNAVPSVIDLDPYTFRLLQRLKSFSLFRVSQQVHRESTHHFFSTHTFRLFPTFPGRYFKTKRPLLARLPTRYRASITSLQLRLGPGWNNPLVVGSVLKVFVECDPSDDFYKGWRSGEGDYEVFCSGLLENVLTEIPTITVVELDGYPAVKRSGDMMSGLTKVVKKFDKVIGWGSESGWDKEEEQIAFLDAVLIHGATRRASKSIAA
ncbi:hypothetical protein B0J14DRAFT_610424 [Halenospora varia]|nr:hypothetical protein B0J14DRAFT_610424 [Halenospora varia]